MTEIPHGLIKGVVLKRHDWTTRLFSLFVEATEPEIKVVINAGQFATSPPQYWHRIELSDDAQFNINFWSDQDKTGKKMFSAK
ncbi:DUF1971 domain-containing protein [Aliivibrio wodanis]|uniref:DUF1971 domain-containing protein n=1 Tax=Aliivibrio wodanis TaxID=80852 RepID=UPI00406C58E7